MPEIIPIPKPKKKNGGSLAKRAQDIFNKFIRYRDLKPYGKCITCPAIIHRHHGSNASHFKSGDKRHWGTRFDEKFCHASCIHCNWTLEGNQAIYEKVLIEKFGPGIIDEFHVKNKLASKKPGDLWLREQIKVYTQKCKELE